MKLPRNAQLWLPAYVQHRLSRMVKSEGPARRVWVAIADHYEPLWNTKDLNLAKHRVALWQNAWPEIAARAPKDSAGSPPKYTFFFPQEEYRKEFLDPLAEMTHSGIADVEVHIHHDREGRENFIDRMTQFCKVLFNEHGLLRKVKDKISFGFIHGNWALDNSLPDGRWCGLNDEITILRDLGCYSDFTMPSGNSASQARTVNTIYWCKDDPEKPKSYDYGTPLRVGGGVEGDLLMIPGPLGLRWTERLVPRLETGEVASNDVPTPYRVARWFDLAPRIGDDIFIKLYTHGTQERNSSVLLKGVLDDLWKLIAAEAANRKCQYYFVSAWQLYLAVDALRSGQSPLSVVEATSVTHV